MKLLVDMNLSPRWVGVLADAGIEIVASMVGEREQIFTIKRRIVILRNEKSGRTQREGDGRLSHQRTTRSGPS